MQREGTGEVTCEICGRKVESPSYYRVNGGKMILCKVCAVRGGYEKVKTRKKREKDLGKRKTGKTTKSKQTKEKTRRRRPKRKKLVQNYGEKIRSARIRSNLTKKELARKIKEKASFLSKIEKEQMRPPKNLIPKIEGYLGIKLTERQERSTMKSGWGDKEEITVGDIVQIKGKKRKNEE